jgi:hypothetical protein
VKTATINLVDLAGSEGAKKTGATGEVRPARKALYLTAGGQGRRALCSRLGTLSNGSLTAYPNGFSDGISNGSLTAYPNGSLAALSGAEGAPLRRHQNQTNRAL